jgi:hypothetical protein
MAPGAPQLEQLRTDLLTLVARHRRTKIWFWRTGAAALVAAGLWIILYIFGSEQAGVKEQLAIMIGAALMWLLFLWSFFLLRKLGHITIEVRKLEGKIIDQARCSAGDAEGS